MESLQKKFEDELAKFQKAQQGKFHSLIKPTKPHLLKLNSNFKIYKSISPKDKCWNRNLPKTNLSKK